MAEKYSFFNAEMTDDGKYDREYLAEDLAAYFASFIGNGVYAKDTNSLKVVPVGGMNLAVKAGKGWCNGYYYENDSDLILTVDNASGTLDRIDSVVLRLDFINRYMRVFVKKGIESSSPSAPALTRTEDVYELQLATVYVKAAIIELKDGNVTDTRFYDSVCGVVKGVVEQISTEDLFSQYDDIFNTWFEAAKDVLNTDAAVQLSNRIDDVVDGTTPVAKATEAVTAQNANTLETKSLSEIVPNFSSSPVMMPYKWIDGKDVYMCVIILNRANFNEKTSESYYPSWDGTLTKQTVRTLDTKTSILKDGTKILPTTCAMSVSNNGENFRPLASVRPSSDGFDIGWRFDKDKINGGWNISLDIGKFEFDAFSEFTFVIYYTK